MFSEQFIRMLEYPSAVIECDIKTIQLKCADKYTDYIYVENSGYGTLSCDICSDLSIITFNPSQWSNNNQTVSYEVDTSACKIGDFFQGEVVISSNGGEIIIPVKIEVVPTSLTADDEKIYSLSDFYNLTKVNPKAAKKLFINPTFLSWLQRNENHYYPLCVKLLEDPNKDRALENFLVACDFKQKTSIAPLIDLLEINVPTETKTKHKGIISVKKSSQGYVECLVESRFDSPWLSLQKHKLTDADFNEDLIAEVPFVVDSSKLKENAKNYNKVEFITDDLIQECNIVVTRKKIVNVYFNQKSYRLEDEGTIIVENSSGKDALVEIISSDSIVKFQAKKFMISKRGEIPFVVKVGGLLSGAGFAGFFQKPLITADIQLKITIDGVPQRKTLNLSVGNLIQL